MKDIETDFEHVRVDPVIINSEIQWSESFICQKKSKERLVFPGSSNHELNLEEQYSKHVKDIRRFESIEQFSVPLKNIFQIQHLENKCVINKAVYHKR